MYKVIKTLEVSASHQLNLSYDSPCSNRHGHNWKITITCENDVLNNSGMVVDFARIKAIVHDGMDHKHLNDVFNFNPTAENIAQWIYKHVPLCVHVRVQESENNIAEYFPDQRDI